MAGPSLSEITSIRGDAAIAAGTAPTAANLANLPADNIGLQILDKAASAQMQANRYAMDQYYQNMREYFKNFNDLDVSGIMEQDYPEVVGEWARLAKDVAGNYDVVMNPMKDLDRYSQLKQREASLRGKIAQSKQDVALRQMYGNFISTHQDFRTPDNLERLTRFSDSGVGLRNRDDLMNVLPKWDLMQEQISKAANIAAQAKTKEQDTARPFQTTTEINQFYKDAYDGAVKSMLRGDDAYGRTMSAAVQDAFNQAPQSVKTLYQNDDGSFRLEDFAAEQLYGPLRQQTDISVTRSPNPFSEIAARGEEERKSIAARGAQERANMKYGKDLGDEDINSLASEIPVRQLSIFGLPNQPTAKAEAVNVNQKTTGDKQADQAINEFSKLFNVSGLPAESVQGVPLTLDSWLTNAYSIPAGKRTVIDPNTRKPVEEDNYLRPQNAWITTEADPNARKVVVRYKDEASGGTRDVVLPYAENFQVLNNVVGQSNAVKLGGAKVKLLKRLTGEVNPNFQKLSAIREFANPNTGGTTVTGQAYDQAAQPAPGPAPAAGGVPTNPTGGRSLKYEDFLKQQKQGGR